MPICAEMNLHTARVFASKVLRAQLGVIKMSFSDVHT